MADIKLGITISADAKGATQNIDAVKRSVEGLNSTSKQTGGAVGGLSQGIGTLGNQSAKASTGIKSTETRLSGLSNAAGIAQNAMLGLGAALSARALITTADAFSNLTAKLKLTSGTAQEYARAQAQIFAISQANMTPLTETVQLYQRVAQSMRDLGRSQTETLQVTDLVGKALRISGASSAAASGGLLQFSQALASGVLRGDEFNSIMESMPRLATAIADGLGVPIGALRKMAEEGKLTSEAIIQAIQSQSAVIQEEYKKIPLTVSAAMTQVSNAWLKYIGETDQASGSSRQLAESISEIAKNLTTVLDPLVSFVGTIVSGWAKIIESIKQVQIAMGDLDAYKEQFDVNSAISLEEWKQRQAGQAANYSTGGGFGGEDPKPYFDGIKRGATEAAVALKGLSAAQNAVAQQVIETAKAYKVDPAWALAIAEQESGFNQLAVSAKGARGVMQLMPGTAKQLGVDFANLNENIKGGVIYLRQQKEEFKSFKLASAAYNAGEGNVRKYGGVPPFKETQKYVISVEDLFQKWQKVLGTQGEVFQSGKELADEQEQAFTRMSTHQDAATKAAEAYAKVQVESIKTQMAGLAAEEQALKRNTEAQLASARTFDEKAKIIASAAQQEAAMHDRAMELLGQEYSARQKAIEVKKAGLQTELANADKYNIKAQDRLKIQTEIGSAESELQILAQNRAQAEIAAGSKVNEIAQQGTQLKQKESAAIGELIAEYAREIEILDKLTKAKAAGATPQQLNIQSQLYEQTGGMGALISDADIAKATQYKLSILAIKEARQELIGVAKNQLTAEQAVREEQLRLNAAYEDGVRQAQLFATHAVEAFGQVGEGIGKVVVSVAQFAQQMMQAERDMGNVIAAAKEKFAGDELAKREYSAQEKYATKAAQYQIALFGDITQAAKGYFKEGSKGYAALENATKVFRAFEMAMAIKSMVTQLTGISAVSAAGTAEVAVSAANSAAEGAAAAPAAVAQAGAQSGWPGAIAMAALMMALGFAVAGAIAGGGMSASERRKTLQEQAGTGTVLGDNTAQSQSIADSLTIIRDNSTNDLDYSAGILAALRNIESALVSAAAGLFTSVVPTLLRISSNLGLSAQRLILGTGQSKQVSDAGLIIPDQSLRQALKQVVGEMYMDITRTIKFIGITLGKSTKEFTAAMDTDTGAQFTKIIRSIRLALIEGGKAFGLTADDFNYRLRNFVVSIGKISLQGLSGEQAAKQIGAIFSKLTDQMANKLMPGLKSFQQLGEGYAATFFRLAEAILRSTGELEQLGMTAINYSAIINKGGDVSAEIARQTIMAQSHLSDATKEYVQGLEGTSEDIIDAYKQLVQASSLMKTGGFQGGDTNLDRTLINAGGGLDAFVSAMENYTEEFLNQAEQVGGEAARVGELFSNLGVAMPGSKDGFRALMESIDLTTESGKKLFGALLQISPAFAELANKIQGIKDKYAEILNPFGKVGDQIDTVIDDFNTLIADAAARAKSTIDALDTVLQKELAPLKAGQSDAAGMKALLQKRLEQSQKQYADAQKIFDEQMAKLPVRRDKKKLSQAITDMREADEAIRTLTGFIETAGTEIAYFQQAMDDLNAKFAGASGVERARLEVEKAGLVADANRVMGATLEQIFNDLAATVEAAQAKVEAVVNLQKSLATQIAQLQGPAATNTLMGSRKTEAMGAIDEYIRRVQEGVKRNTDTEIRLIQEAQGAVMDKYNAEMALLASLTSSIEALTSFIDGIGTKIAQLQGNGTASTAALGGQRRNQAMSNIESYIGGVQGGATRDYGKETVLLQAAEAAVMEKYNAELALIQETTAAQSQALQDGLTAQVDSINSATQAAVDAANAGSAAQIDAINAASAAAISAQQKVFDTANKATQKAYDAENEAQQDLFDAANEAKQDALDLENKATQKAYDAQNKTQQKAYDAVNKSQQKAYDAQNQALQKGFDAQNKAQQKSFDAQNKAQQKAYDAVNKSQQKAYDAQNQAQQKALDAQNKAQQKAFDATNKAQQKANDAVLKQRQKADEATLKSLQKQQELALKGLQDELEAATKLHDALAAIADYAINLKTSPQADLSPEAQLQATAARYQDLLAKSRGGDAEAASQLAGASDAYLEAAKNYYGSSTQYQDIFTGVQAAMESVGAMDSTDPDSIQARIDALQTAQGEELDRVRELQQDAIDLLREQQQTAQEMAQEIQQGIMDASREQQQAMMDQQRELQQEAMDAVREQQQDAMDQQQELQQASLDAAREQQQAAMEQQQELQQEAMDAVREQQQDAMDLQKELQQAAIDETRKQQQKAMDLQKDLQQDAMDATKEQQQEAMDAMREQQQSTLDGMRSAADAQVEAIRSAIAAQVDAIQAGAKATIDALQNDVAAQVRDLADPMKNGAILALKEATIADLQRLQMLAEISRAGAQADADRAVMAGQAYQQAALNELQYLSQLAEITRIEAAVQATTARGEALRAAQDAVWRANDQLGKLQAGNALSAAQLGALNEIAMKMGGRVTPVPGFAKGGSAPAGQFWVGERGPEIVNFERPAQVTSTDQVRKAVMGDEPKTFAALEAIKAELKAIVTTQSHANPLLIDKLANIEDRLSKMERNQRLNV